MNNIVDPNGLSQSDGVSAAVRQYGKSLATDIVKCHARFLAGDYDKQDSFGRSYYATSVGLTIVFNLPAAPPWFAVVSLPQELSA